MKSKERLLNAIIGEKIDRLPVTTHHLMPYFLNKYADGMEGLEFHKKMGFDPIVWSVPLKAKLEEGQYIDEEYGILCSENWKLSVASVSGYDYETKCFRFMTPEGNLQTKISYNDYTFWTTEYLLKSKEDMELFARYAPYYYCDTEKVKEFAATHGDEALIRGHIPGFLPMGQPGCWQDVACLYGIEKLILEVYDDPDWVHYACKEMQKRKITFIESLEGVPYDILELGGGDASTTVISPAIFREFVSTYDKPLIELAHKKGQRIVYHTCGGMMPILEDLVDLGADALETFTPPDMGGDVDLKKAKEILGDQVCMIGGFDQGHYLYGCTEEQTREAVRKCFRDAGEGGRYILSPSDHFFDAEMELIKVFVDEAKKCLYE